MRPPRGRNKKNGAGRGVAGDHADGRGPEDPKKPGPDEDAELWAQATRGVKKLPGAAAKTPVSRKTPGRASERGSESDYRAGAIYDHHMVPGSASHAPADAARSVRKGREVDRRTRQRLERGELEIEGRIDLHGMTQDRAQAALTRYLLAARQAGQRTVLVVTGKGGTGRAPPHEDWWETAPGILRQRVPDWLDSPPLRDIVLQYRPARPQHGGDGALYVLLRRPERR